MLQAFADGDKQCVTGRVADTVVDILEIVDVDEEDGLLPTGAGNAGARVFDAIAEQCAVCQTCQRVMKCLMN